MKVIQKVKAWAYPCDGKIKETGFGDIYIATWNGWYVKKKDLVNFHKNCRCGKNHKPVNIVITVEEV